MQTVSPPISAENGVNDVSPSSAIYITN